MTAKERNDCKNKCKNDESVRCNISCKQQFPTDQTKLQNCISGCSYIYSNPVNINDVMANDPTTEIWASPSQTEMSDVIRDIIHKPQFDSQSNPFNYSKSFGLQVSDNKSVFTVLKDFLKNLIIEVNQETTPIINQNSNSSYIKDNPAYHQISGLDSSGVSSTNTQPKPTGFHTLAPLAQLPQLAPLAPLPQLAPLAQLPQLNKLPIISGQTSHVIQNTLAPIEKTILAQTGQSVGQTHGQTSEQSRIMQAAIAAAKKAI